MPQHHREIDRMDQRVSTDCNSIRQIVDSYLAMVKIAICRMLLNWN